MKMDETIIFNKNQNSINLKKLAKGYGWEIKVYGDDLDKIRKMIKVQDVKMRAEFSE